MSKIASALDTLPPPAAAAALRKFGADLATARKRRQQPLRAWAARLDVSVPTLMKMEKADAAMNWLWRRGAGPFPLAIHPTGCALAFP